MAELANRKGVEGDAAAKKAAFLREAEEAVKRAAMQVRLLYWCVNACICVCIYVCF